MDRNIAIANLIDGARQWRSSLSDDGWTEGEIRSGICRRGPAAILDALYELDKAEQREEMKNISMFWWRLNNAWREIVMAMRELIGHPKNPSST